MTVSKAAYLQSYYDRGGDEWIEVSVQEFTNVQTLASRYPLSIPSASRYVNRNYSFGHQHSLPANNWFIGLYIRADASTSSTSKFYLSSDLNRTQNREIWDLPTFTGKGNGNGNYFIRVKGGSSYPYTAYPSICTGNINIGESGTYSGSNTRYQSGCLARMDASVGHRKHFYYLYTTTNRYGS